MSVEPSTPAPPLDRIVFQGTTITVGAFRCPTWHPAFADSGPIGNFIFVFPRRAVRLRHEGEAPFLADPSVVTLYNRGQRYARSAVSARGDDCEWFAVDRHALVDALSAHDPGARDRPERPFRHAFGPCPPRAYLAQRALFERLSSGLAADPLGVEEAVLSLLAQVVASVYGFWGASTRPRPLSRRQWELAEGAKSFLSQRLGDPLHLGDIARAVGSSPFHLCRTFRAATGTTLHAYRNLLRLQESLGRVAAHEDLTQVALDLGFSSHSHFTESFRRLFGTTPRAARDALIPLDTTKTRPE